MIRPQLKNEIAPGEVSALTAFYNILGAPCFYDEDGDGVCDPFDNCVSVFNSLQFDTDADGFGDDCDNVFH